MCMNGYWQAWETLMTSKVESANDMHAMSGSLLGTPIVLCENTGGKKDKNASLQIAFIN